MLNPQFPYRGNQLILSSDRVLLHSEKDAIFLFGKEAIGLSSTKTINLDANEKVLIACDKIELGYKAEEEGEPVVLGYELTRKLVFLLEALSNAGDLLSKANTTTIADAMIAIHSAGVVIKGVSDEVKFALEKSNPSGGLYSDSPILSKNTFTR